MNTPGTSRFRIPILNDKKDEISALAAGKIVAQIKGKPNSCLGLPTGRTPLAMYEHLVKLTWEQGLDWSSVHCFALDEYLDIETEHSFQTYLETNLYNRVGVPVAHRHNPTMCQNYDKLILDHGGLDLTVLGIGGNGHIAFNEPGTPRLSFTQCIWLDDSSRQVLSSAFSSLDRTPTKAVTMGISTILSSQAIVMLAFGADKKRVLERAFSNGINSEIPASYLRLHDQVSVLTD